MSTYGNLCLARFASLVLCSFVMNVRRLRMAPSCVAVGQLASQYGVEWAVCMRGVASGFSLVVPSFANSSASSLPVMPVWARTLCMCILYGVQYICRTIAAMRSLSGWWCCDVGWWIWLLIRYMLLRLSVNMYVSVLVICIFLTARSIALSSALSMFWYPSSLSEIFVLLLGL